MSSQVEIFWMQIFDFYLKRSFLNRFFPLVGLYLPGRLAARDAQRTTGVTLLCSSQKWLVMRRMSRSSVREVGSDIALHGRGSICFDVHSSLCVIKWLEYEVSCFIANRYWHLKCLKLWIHSLGACCVDSSGFIFWVRVVWIALDSHSGCVLCG